MGGVNRRLRGRGQRHAANLSLRKKQWKKKKKMKKENEKTRTTVFCSQSSRTGKAENRFFKKSQNSQSFQQDLVKTDEKENNLGKCFPEGGAGAPGNSESKN